MSTATMQTGSQPSDEILLLAQTAHIDALYDLVQRVQDESEKWGRDLSSLVEDLLDGLETLREQKRDDESLIEPLSERLDEAISRLQIDESLRLLEKISDRLLSLEEAAQGFSTPT